MKNLKKYVVILLSISIIMNSTLPCLATYNNLSNQETNIVDDDKLDLELESDKYSENKSKFHELNNETQNEEKFLADQQSNVDTLNTIKKMMKRYLW